MEELERLPEWAGRKAETRVSKETWSAAELNEPLISLEVEEPAANQNVLATGEAVPIQQAAAQTGTIPIIADKAPRRARWLFAVATISLLAGIGAGVLYVAVMG